jgi:glycosyltransferase involved in cell wall biosynthesis
MSLRVRQEAPVVNNKVLNIAVITNIIPSYREGFYDRVLSRKDLFVKVYCQSKIPGMNFITLHDKYPNNVQLLHFITANRQFLSWQFIPWKEILSGYDVVFVSGNPRIISDVLAAVILKLTQRKVVLWTMAHSYRANKIREKVRLLWSRLFKYIFVYTDAEVEYLKRKGFRNHYMVGMNNGLDQKKIDAAISKWPEPRLKEWRRENKLEGRTLLLSCSRLEPKNKYQLFVQALPAIVDRIPNIVWCVIGDGSAKGELEFKINAAGLSQHARLVGELYNEEELAPWFRSSELFVHPAAIGLSIMHAFGYGLPVVTHGNPETQNPEYAAFEPGLTGRNYKEDDIHDLSETVINLLRDHEERAKMKDYVQRVAREKYNVDVMVERFVDIANRASGNTN